MLYRVFVQPQQPDREPVALDYELDNNPLVDLWLDCVRTQLSRPWKVNHLQWTRTFTTKATLAQALKELEESREELELDPSMDINALHLLFHNYYEGRGVPDHRWDRLNLRIHKVEEQTRTINDPQGQRTGWAFVLSGKSTDLVEERAIPSWLRHHWFHVPRSGELILGYYTVGKTIADCYRDNDVECVRSGGVRPQITVSTETTCLWSPEPGAIRDRPLLADVEKWVKDNQLEDYVDLGLKENQYYGAPRLGEYVGTLTVAEINSLLTNAGIVGAELIE